MRHGHDEPLIAERLNRSPSGLPRNSEQADEILLRGQRIEARPELACLYPVAQPCRYLTVWGLGGPRIDLRHVHIVKLADQV